MTMHKQSNTLLSSPLSESKVFFIYLVLFVQAEVISQLSTPFFLLIVLFNFWLSLTDKTKRDLVLFSSFLLGSEAMVFLNLFVFLFFSRNKLVHLLRTEKNIKISLAVVFSLSLLQGILQNTLWNVLGYSAYLSILVLVGVAAADTVKSGRLVALITKFIWLECVITALIFLRLRSFGYVDAYYGTLKNAHTFGNWLILALYVLCSDAYCNGKASLKEIFRTHGLTIGAIVAMLWLTDAKILILCALLSVAIFWAFRFVKKNRLLKFVLGLYGAAFVLLAVLKLDFIRDIFYRLSPSTADYLYRPGWNGKLIYIQGTFLESLKGFRLFTGYGLGQFGSRVANAFAYDSMWRDSNFLNNMISTLFDPHSLQEYTQYISYYTAEFVGQIWSRSAILSYPFNSFTAIIGETGLIGVTVLAYVLNRLFGNKRYTYIVYYFLLACVFDTYLDNILCVGPVIIYLVNAAPAAIQNTQPSNTKRRNPLK